MQPKIFCAMLLIIVLNAQVIFCAETKKVYSVPQLLTSVVFHENERAKQLIQAGANPNYQGLNGLTPLMAAMTHCDDVELVRILVGHGANVKAKITSKSEWKYNGFTALHYLAYSESCSTENFKAMVDILLAAGANINEKDEKGNTPLHLASERGFAPNVRYLLSKGANPEIKNERGERPVDLVSDIQLRRILLSATHRSHYKK